ncbi:hypothetical protein QWY82_11530 [Simiduia curdlanivorans]|uniref:Uncharacterized protein n=1 Tax=Simiduia curdlanivorans TaxID=1492769 RepID=A0ABV8V8I8_9GAMM|nr:hypothetical protein [Simiduia curdlanivorans]MDN3639435.1 hypothetical protein [Simiduia curdlanivorans]
MTPTPPAARGHISAVLVFVFCTCLPISSLGLDPQFEADRLLMATEAALSRGDIAEAKAHKKDAQALKIALPADFDYFIALLLEHDGNTAKAIASFERYVGQTGKTGRFYKESLAGITRLKNKPVSNTQSNAQDIAWGGPSQLTLSGAEYSKKIQKLYKAPSASEGLRRHINSLLQFYGTPYQASDNKHFYELIIEQDMLITLLRADNDSRDIRVNNARFSVFGLDPYVKSDCGKGIADGPSCWIKDPRSGQPWLIIKPSDEGIAELSKALTLLIRQLQR